MLENPRNGQDFKTKGAISMSVGLLDHFNIRTRKLTDTVRFYEEVLEFENGDRPNFSFPGAWMYSEGKPVVHLVDISKPTSAETDSAWSIVAFASRACRHEAAAEVEGLPFDVREVPGVAVWQIFVTIPTVMLELNYEMANEKVDAVSFLLFALCVRLKQAAAGSHRALRRAKFLNVCPRWTRRAALL